MFLHLQNQDRSPKFGSNIFWVKEASLLIEFKNWLSLSQYQLISFSEQKNQSQILELIFSEPILARLSLFVHCFQMIQNFLYILSLSFAYFITEIGLILGYLPFWIWNFSDLEISMLKTLLFQGTNQNKL